MKQIEIWQETFDNLRDTRRQAEGAVNRAQFDHDSAMRSGDVDAILRSKAALQDTTARLNVVSELVEQHRSTRETANRADEKNRLAELVAAHEPLKAEGLPALERILAALETFDAEVGRFASVVTRIQNSARQCGQLPAIRINGEHNDQVNRIYHTQQILLDAVRRAGSVYG